MRLRVTLPMMVGGFAFAAACVPQAPVPGPSGSVAPNPVPITAVALPAATSFKADAAQITWSSMVGGQPLRAMVCGRADTDPLFVDAARSCTSAMFDLPGAPSNNAGTRSIDLFRGAAPSPDPMWGCAVPGDTGPSAVELHTTCFVRLVSGDPANPTARLDVPFTLVDEPIVPDPVVPDLPGGPAVAAVGVTAAAGVVTWGRRWRGRRPVS